MGAIDEQQLLVGGTLSFAGTNLGTMHAVALEMVGVLDDIRAEEFGGEVWDQVYLREEWVCTAILANYDSDALSNYFPNVAGSGVAFPGSFAWGGLMNTQGGSLVLTPHNSGSPRFTLHNAIPQLTRTVMPFNAQEPLLVEMTWLGVRNASDNVVSMGLSPETILAGSSASLVAWFDASDNSTITSDANGISSWADKSAAGATALTQGTDANKPNVASAAFNGLDAILFDDANGEFLQAAAAEVTAAPFRWFIVSASDLATVPVVFEIAGTATNRWQMEVRTNGETRIDIFDTVQEVLLRAADPGVVITANTAYLMHFYEASSTDHRLEINGTEADTDTADSSPNAVTTTTVGADVLGNNTHSGHVMEIILVDESGGTMSAAEVTAMESYLGDRWGITIA